MSERVFSTPMMQQYIQIKNQYSDCILMFRLGDFYELFLEDAEIGAQILGIALTARPRGKDGDIPMAGVPFHSADSYIAKLVRAGFKVAICEQVSQPDSKGIVDREVVRIITPGTITDEANLNHKHHNFLLSVMSHKDQIGLAFAELSTGELWVSNFQASHLTTRLSAELARFQPAEIIHDPHLDVAILKILKQSHATLFALEAWKDYTAKTTAFLKQHFRTNSLDKLNLTANSASAMATAAVLHYLDHTQQQMVPHLTTVKTFDALDSVVMDASTIANLELFETLRDHHNHGSLISVLDKTHTAMGGRLLRQWLKHPLNNQALIEARLEAVDFLIKDSALSEKLTTILGHLSDLERLISRLNLRQGNPKDLLKLEYGLASCLEVKATLRNISDPLLGDQSTLITPTLGTLHQAIRTTLKENVPVDPKKGNFIAKGLNPQLDAYREVINESKDWIARSQESERVRTGIGSLKIKFNKVFGYYIEVSKTNLSQVPDDYQRKQTLVNAERFITPGLKEHEDIILSHEAKALELELDIFEKLIEQINNHTSIIQQTARAIATIDCLLCLATIAIENKYAKPNILPEGNLHLSDSRHPVVEQLLDAKRFVPNDAHLGDNPQLIIITGPNMAGKSVYMRQVALTILMAHMGSFVPTTKADIPVIDRLFVRSGAADVISQGLSTFMVEMVETAHILNQATDKSFVIMDEIGRGTTTYDGISIAWAVAEYLVSTIKAKTLFATHYHELQELADKYPEAIANFQAAVELHQGEPIFLHRILEGKATASYGISVAKLAGVPDKVRKDADVMLSHLQSMHAPVPLAETKPAHPVIQPALPYEDSDGLKAEISQIDIARTTPLEALNILARLKAQVE